MQAPIGQSSGYHRDGLGLVRAFNKTGAYVTIQPSDVTTPIPEDVAKVLTHEPDYPFDLFLNHLSPHMLKIPDDIQDVAWKKIAWTMWEWDSFGPNTDKIRDCLEGYDLILGYDDTSVKALQSTGTTVPIRKLQGGYEADVWADDDGRIVERDWFAEEFVFVIAGELTPRKNPYVLLRALSQLWQEGYKFKLIMKNKFAFHLPPRLEEAYPFLTVENGTWPVERMRKLYEGAHCYVAPSQGEGKNLPAIEAGTTGCALILSDVAGHREWCRPEISTVVGGVWNDYDAGCGCLYVDETELREACREMMDNRQKAMQMGKIAHDILPSMLSWDSVTRKLITEHLNRI